MLPASYFGQQGSRAGVSLGFLTPRSSLYLSPPTLSLTHSQWGALSEQPLLPPLLLESQSELGYHLRGQRGKRNLILLYDQKQAVTI